MQVLRRRPSNLAVRPQLLNQVSESIHNPRGKSDAGEQTHNGLMILPRRFYERPPEEVAPDLLGCQLIHGERRGRIVEVEAYLGAEDKAAHSARGITPRTKVIFGPPGHAYVYLIYGMYECLNFVTNPDGVPGCVLIRAIEPIAGIDRPANGPGRLTRAMAITREHYGADLTRGPLIVRQAPRQEAIRTGPRIGMREYPDRPLRFWLQGNPHVSR